MISVMPESLNQLKNGTKKVLLRFFTNTLPALFLSLTFFIGGITLLALRVPFWSLFLGLPAVQIGIVFLIFTFDVIAQEKVGTHSLYITSCPICNNPVLTHSWEKEKICTECQKKIAKKLKIKGD